MSATRRNSIFTRLYCTRLCLAKGDTPIANVSLLFGIIALLTAPWLVIGAAIACVALGYRFSVVRNAAGFNGDLDAVVQQAGRNVRTVVERVTESRPQA